VNKDSRLGVNPLDWIACETSGRDKAALLITGGKTDGAAAPAGSPEASKGPGRTVQANQAAQDCPGAFLFKPLCADDGLGGLDGTGGADKRKVKIHNEMRGPMLAEVLKELAGALASGGFVVEGGEERVAMAAPESAQFEVKAALKKGRRKFSLKISWEDGE